MTAAATATPAREALQGATDALAAAAVDSPRLDAELLLCEATGWDRARLASEPDAAVERAAGREFAAAVRRRLRREPLAYITGRKGFRRIELAVDPRALIPRPETELLVDIALELAPATVLDIGTGSGAIALAIADELPQAVVTATDTSSGALDLARHNAERLGLSDRVRFAKGTVPEDPNRPVSRENAAGDARKGTVPGFELVVANLPYVRDDEWPGLAPEIREFEPREALVAGDDGLDAIRALLAVPPPARAIALEVGAGQAAEVAELVRAAGFPRVESRNDLAEIERVVIGR
jgi:release factor glutamine methyltransferase